MKIRKFIPFVLTAFLLMNFSFKLAGQSKELKKVALVIDGSKKVRSIKNWLISGLDEINKENTSYKYIFVDKYIRNSKSESFSYVLELDPGGLNAEPEVYNYVTYKEKKVEDKSEEKKGKSKKKDKNNKKTTKKKSTDKKKKNEKEEKKYKVIKIPVYHSGVKFKQKASFIGRMYDVVTGKYLNGFIVDFNVNEDYQDSNLRLEIDKLKVKKRKVKDYKKKEERIKKKYIEKYKSDMKRDMAKFKKRFLQYAYEKIQYNTAYPFEFPQQIVDVVKKTKKKAKVVQLSGSKYMQDQSIDNVCALVSDENGYKYYDRIAQSIVSDSYYDKNQVKVWFSRKKVLKAWEAKQKMIITRYNEQSNYVDDTIKKMYTVLPVFERNPSSLLLYKVNYYLNVVPIFEVLDRGKLINIRNVQELLKSEKVLEDENAFGLRDKLKGADFIVLFDRMEQNAANVKLIETKTGKLLSEVKMDLPYSNTSEMNFYSLLVPAFKLNTEIYDISKASKTKAKKVYVHSMFPLKNKTKYIVYKVEKRIVNGKELDRTVEVGELKIKKLYSRTLALAKVKDGGKDILKHFNKGDKLICLPKKEKKGFFAQFFSEIFKFDNYENIHTFTDNNVHNANNSMW